MKPVTIKCPNCGALTEYSERNHHRPFCSERCQTLDLGGWADERYKIPGPATTQNPEATTNPSETSTSSQNEDADESGEGPLFH